jgi:ABC-type transport system substrate-binding protein
MSHSSRPSTFSCSLTTPCCGLMLNFVPDLAESWEILENSKVYVFHLCKAVTFHDGTDFDAEAVRWNYRRVVDPEEKTLDAAYYIITTSSTRWRSSTCIPSNSPSNMPLGPCCR